jgi:NADPH:quinone reductase-like Zn-dependent oxidoreductase
MVVPAGQLLPLSEAVSLTDAACLPKVAFTMVDRLRDQPSLTLVNQTW